MGIVDAYSASLPDLPKELQEGDLKKAHDECQKCLKEFKEKAKPAFDKLNTLKTKVNPLYTEIAKLKKNPGSDAKRKAIETYFRAISTFKDKV